MTPRTTTTRRGLSLTEAVFATAILGVVASSLFGAVGFLNADAQRERIRLAAMEIAHRLVLEHLDDPAANPTGAGDELVYGDESFRWTLRAYDLEGRRSADRLGRMRVVCVRVWPGGALGQPWAELVRIYDALPASPGAGLRQRLDTPEGLRYIIELLGDEAQ